MLKPIDFLDKLRYSQQYTLYNLYYFNKSDFTTFVIRKNYVDNDPFKTKENLIRVLSKELFRNTKHYYFNKCSNLKKYFYNTYWDFYLANKVELKQASAFDFDEISVVKYPIFYENSYITTDINIEILNLLKENPDALSPHNMEIFESCNHIFSFLMAGYCGHINPNIISSYGYYI